MNLYKMDRSIQIQSKDYGTCEAWKHNNNRRNNRPYNNNYLRQVCHHY